jgi:PAS domain S-box-containing protein
MNLTSRTVLIIDDSPEDCELYRRYLRHDRNYTYTVLEAELGQQGLDLWRRYQPDVVLLGYQLPDVDGLEVLKQLQQISHQICLPVVVVTGQGNEAIAVEMIKAGSQDYLMKGNITPERLQLAVNSAIETAQLRNQLQQCIERERLIAQLSQKIHQSLELEEILQTTVDEVRQFLKTDRVLIFQLQLNGCGTFTTESVGSEWNSILSASDDDPDLHEKYIEPFQQEWGTVKPDIYDGSLNPSHVELLESLQVRANLEVPLLQNDTLWGMLIVHHCAAPRQWQATEVDLLKEIATQMGIALRQSELHQKLKTELEERKHAERWLQEGQVQLQQQLAEIEAIYQSAPIGLSVLDQSLRFVRINQRLAEINGFPVEAHIGRTVRELLPNIADKAEQLLRPVLETGEPRFNVEIQGETPAQPGVQRTWLEHFIPLKKGEQVIGISIVCEETTEQKQAEAALSANEARLRSFVDSNIVGILYGDIYGNIREANDALLTMIGYSREDLQAGAISWIDITPPEFLPLDEQAIAQARAIGACTPYEKEYIRQDGTRVPVLLGYSLVGEAREESVAFILDLTERKRMEEERERLLAQEQAAREEAERANRVKDEFLAILSHELRSPLNPILGWTKLMQSREFEPEETSAALATIERSVKVQIQLIDDLLDIAKILRGKLTMKTEPVNLVTAVESAIETVQSAAQAKSIQLQAVLPQLGLVIGDPTRLQQIVWNLLSNAIKFTPDQGRAEIRLEQVGNWAQIIVSDTGKGIKPDFLPHLFESFRQEDASTTRRFGGLGLGLAIVRSLVEAHGGTIWAASPGEGQGATFTVQLPLLTTVLEPIPTDQPNALDLNLTNIRVLAVDDDLDVQEVLTAILTQAGAEVLTVASAAEVLTALDAFQPDVLVSDIGMPELDGYTLIRHIQALFARRGKYLPAIALTAYASREDAQRALREGFQQHLSKPIEPAQLIQAIARCIR